MVVKADLGVLLAGGLKLSLAEHEDQAYDPYLSTPRAFGLVGKTVEIVDTFLGKSEVDGGTIQVSERVGSDLVLTIERPNGTLRVVQATQNNASRHVRIVHE